MNKFILILAFIFLTAGETEWTVSTLKQYCDVRFEDMEKAVRKQEADNAERFRNSNEFRASLEDQQRTFMPRTEAEAIIKNLTTKLEILDGEINRMQASKSGGNSTVAYIIAIISTIVAIVMALKRWNIDKK